MREVEKGDGRVENVYRLQVMNATESAHRYTVLVEGVPGLSVVSGQDFTVEAAATRAVPIRLGAPRGALDPGSHPIRISVRAEGDTDLRVTEKSVFLVRK